MLYETTLTLPGQSFASNAKLEVITTFVQESKNKIIAATVRTNKTTPQIYIPKDLVNCQHIFVHNNAVKTNFTFF